MDVLSDWILGSDVEDEQIMHHPEVKSIQHEVETLVQKLHGAVVKTSALYSGFVVGAGSYYDDLKVESPDDFDFNIVLTCFEHGKNFILQPSGFNGTRNLWRTPVGNPLFKKIHLIDDAFADLWHGEKYPFCGSKTFNVGTKRIPEYILCPIEVKNEFYMMVHEILGNMTPPRLLTIVGLTECKGPAISIELKWYGRKFNKLTISVDISLAIEVPQHATLYDPTKLFPEDHPLYKAMVDYFSERECCYTLVPIAHKKNPFKSWRVSSQYLESYILSGFKRDFPMKRLLRFVKRTRKWPNLEARTTDEANACNATSLHPVKYLDLDNLDFDKDLYSIGSYGLKHVFFYMVKMEPKILTNKNTASRLVTMIQLMQHAANKGYIENFFLPAHRIKVPIFENSFEHFEAILSNILDVLEFYHVNKEKKMAVFSKFQFRLFYYDWNIGL